MTAFLTLAAAITMISLLVSATYTATSASASDPYKRGSWGVASWTSIRNRALDPHERRWQTALLSGKDNPSRWRVLLEEIEALERLSNATPIGPAPDDYDASWLEATLANLEAHQVRTPQENTP